MEKLGNVEGTATFAILSRHTSHTKSTPMNPVKIMTVLMETFCL